MTLLLTSKANVYYGSWAILATWKYQYHNHACNMQAVTMQEMYYAMCTVIMQHLCSTGAQSKSILTIYMAKLKLLANNTAALGTLHYVILDKLSR